MGEVVGTFHSSGQGEAHEAIAAARTTFDTAGWPRAASPRSRALNELADNLSARSDDLARMLARENGKLFGQTAWEVALAVDWLRYSAAAALNQIAGRLPSRRRGRTSIPFPKPRGSPGSSRRGTRRSSSPFGRSGLHSVPDARPADGLVEEIVATDPDGTGRVCLCGFWPDGARAALTGLLQACIDELWAGLDSLVTETVAALSILQRRTTVEKVFFPVAETPDGFVALLEESCLDGVLTTQEALVSDCQPFRSSPSSETPRSIREALGRLLDWTNRLHDGAQVGAWVIPVDPQVEIEDSDQVLDLQVASPCPLGDETVVATYTVAPGARVVARAGSYLDLALPAGFEPVDQDDTFDARLAATVRGLIVLAGCFARLFEATSTVREIENDGGGTWTPAERSVRGWSGEELEALRASEFGIGIVHDGDESTILLTTAAGIFERRILAATPLNPHIEPGPAAESATHNAAATWGLPDFVLLPLEVHAGSRNREISDGLLLAGERGVVLQTKNRADHPHPPVDLPLVDHSSSSTAVVTLLRREWEFLFDQLRSTRAVIGPHDPVREVVGVAGGFQREQRRRDAVALQPGQDWVGLGCGVRGARTSPPRRSTPRGRLLLGCIDPSVADETDPLTGCATGSRGGSRRGPRTSAPVPRRIVDGRSPRRSSRSSAPTPTRGPSTSPSIPASGPTAPSSERGPTSSTTARSDSVASPPPRRGSPPGLA